MPSCKKFVWAVTEGNIKSRLGELALEKLRLEQVEQMTDGVRSRIKVIMDEVGYLERALNMSETACFEAETTVWRLVDAIRSIYGPPAPGSEEEQDEKWMDHKIRNALYGVFTQTCMKRERA